LWLAGAEIQDQPARTEFSVIEIEKVRQGNLRGVIKAMDELYPGLGHPPRRRNHRRDRRPNPQDRLFPADPSGLRDLFHPKLEGG
jgi:hypothetical protein